LQAVLLTASAAAVAGEDAAFQAGDVIDDELSRAVVAYLRGAGLAWPRRSLDAVAEAMGSDVAERLGPRLERLADESCTGRSAGIVTTSCRPWTYCGAGSRNITPS